MSIYSVGEICHSDVIYFAHACASLLPIPAHVLAQKSEEETASSASLLATPLGVFNEVFIFNM